MITKEQLDAIAEEFKKAALPAEHCHFCKTPVYRLPFQPTPKINNIVMCLDCAAKYAEYEKLNDH